MIDHEQRARLLDFILRVEVFLHGNQAMRRKVQECADALPNQIDQRSLRTFRQGRRDSSSGSDGDLYESDTMDVGEATSRARPSGGRRRQ